MINLYEKPIKEEENEASFSTKIPSILVRIQDKIDFEAYLKQKQIENTKILQNNSLNKPSKRFNDFLDRNSKFLDIKAQKIIQNSQKSQKMEVKECSFKPKTQKFRKAKTENKCEVIYQGKHYFIDDA